MTPRDEWLATERGPDGRRYSFHYRSGDEKTAVVLVEPSTAPPAGMIAMETVYRVPAIDPTEARHKLAAWRSATWP